MNHRDSSNVLGFREQANEPRIRLYYEFIHVPDQYNEVVN